jgi:toxin-antitoxin system PIN domain toxin
MPASGIRLVDSNLWLALCFGGHQHHQLGASWFESLNSGEAGFCRITQMALLRHLTNSTIMGSYVLSQRRAWSCFDRLFEDDRVIFLEEPDELELRWRTLTRSDEPKQYFWTDAYIAAFALVSRIKVSTIDQDFSRFRGLEIELLQPGAGG